MTDPSYLAIPRSLSFVQRGDDCGKDNNLDNNRRESEGPFLKSLRVRHIGVRGFHFGRPISRT